MRTTEERVLAVKLRAGEIENQKRQGSRHALWGTSLVASLFLLLGLSFLMPGIMASMSDDNYSNTGTVASMFDGSSFFGFVLIGFLAFALGVSLTILAYKIKGLNQLDQKDKEG